ncbi:MarR family transcriptional regulator [Nonomuraea helvata]|uniref:MarR family transcriptional regulator n=1 Tax=Nonomuraea helvata TaxID=37484 RepID=A0ABV5SAK7_9ACTN
MAAVAAFRNLATTLDLLDQVAAARLGVARSDLRYLDILSTRGPLPAGALAEAVGLSAPALSAALRRLEKHDYVRRAHDEHDRRTVRVSLTESAATAIASLFTEVRAATATLLQRLSPAELATVAKVADDLAGAIRAIATRDA